MVDDKVVKITTAGRGLAILLPKDFVDQLNWSKGTRVQLHVSGEVLSISRLRQLENGGGKS